MMMMLPAVLLCVLPTVVVALRSGGRAATSEAKIGQQQRLPALEEGEARCTVIQVTDVYCLENFPYLKTLIREEKAKNPTSTIAVLTGDFLAPYLLSSVDKGKGMMAALRSTPIDYLTLGNHEDDLAHDELCARLREFPGTIISSNMRDHEAKDSMVDYAIVEATSKDGKLRKKVAFVAVLSDDPALYREGAFGGATVEDPWATLREFEAKLEDQVDLVVPLQHTYVPDDYKTCRDFDFDVVLSGHDHHRVDEVVSGTRLLKPGMDAIYATVLEISWGRTGDKDQKKDNNSPPGRPLIAARFEKVNDGRREADPQLAALVEEAYEVLAPLRKTELASIPSSKKFRPLSSKNARGSVTTMGTYLCTLLREALDKADGVLLMGGNVRGSRDYADDAFFSLETLESEIRSDEAIGLVEIPGHVVQAAVEATHAGPPIPGWFQYDDSAREEEEEEEEASAAKQTKQTKRRKKLVAFGGDDPIDPEKVYVVATKIADLTNGQSPPLTAYFTANPHLIPPKGKYFNVHATLMAFFARDLWLRLWDTCFRRSSEDLLDVLDTNKDGTISVDEIHYALETVLGLSVDPTEMSLAKFIFAFADRTHDGRLTLADLRRFRDELDDKITR